MVGRDAGPLEGDGSLHAQRGVAPVPVVLIDPRRHGGPGLGPSSEVLQTAQFELHSGMPGFDHRVVQR